MSQPTPLIVLFDVNETLLDITSIEPLFERVFGDRLVMREWFAQLVLYSQTMTLSGLYTSFNELGVGALKMIAAIYQIPILDKDVVELKTRLGNMPAHPDVLPALTHLRDSGFRLATLTNSPIDGSPTPLDKAGLSHFFEHSFSVENVEKFKPAADTYHMVAKALSVHISELCVVACHFWDIIGAQSAGCQGAFLTRPHNAVLLASEVPTPDFMAAKLTILAEHIILSKQT